MADLFELSIISPQIRIFQGKVYSLSVDLGLGQAQVFANHAPLASLTKAGRINICVEDGKNIRIDLSCPGFFHICNNRAALILKTG